MINNSKYQAYASTVVSEIPTENLKFLVNLLMEDAALNMGATYDPKILDRIIEFTQSRDFNNMTLSVIASAFARGSLGKFGPGRLVPKTVHDWLTEVSIEFKRYQDHKDREDYYSEKPVSFDLHKYPVGKAICKKIDWLKSGAITSDEWDRIPLRDLAERLATGMDAVPELFGVTSHKTG